PLVLHIVGHAVPNGLTPTLNGKRLDETTLAAAITERRGNEPTLIVWDVCFAKSFLHVPRVRWGRNYVHIFSCQAHERTWHNGTNKRRRTLFSEVLKGAIRRPKDDPLTWRSLQQGLREELDAIQTPEVHPMGNLTPQAFGL